MIRETAIGKMKVGAMIPANFTQPNMDDVLRWRNALLEVSRKIESMGCSTDLSQLVSMVSDVSHEMQYWLGYGCTGEEQMRCIAHHRQKQLAPEDRTEPFADWERASSEGAERLQAQQVREVLRAHDLLVDGFKADGGAHRRYSEGWERTFGRLGGK